MTDQSIAKRNIVVLTFAQALGASSSPVIVSLGGLVGQNLSPNPALATLPVSMFGLGLAIAVLPGAMLMNRIGRRNAYLFGTVLGGSGGLVAAAGIWMSSFLVFCLGTLLAGFYAAFVQSYRFAATDHATGELRAKAISWVMVGGLAAAIIGPQLVVWTQAAIPSAPFAGSFLSQTALALLAFPVLLLLFAPRPPAMTERAKRGGRNALQLLATPRYALAVAAGVVSYGLMTFVMTAAPMAMVGHGHSIDHAALGIQWHVLAMFAPSFFTGHLIARMGKEKVTAIGLLLIGLGSIIALVGLDVANFWGSLILLGVGWNFGFLGATAMLLDTYRPEERGVAQGTNDLLVFGVVAIGSFSSGGLLQASGWQAVNWMVFPAIALVLVPLVWFAARSPAKPLELKS